jgi:hypothetical protein
MGFLTTLTQTLKRKNAQNILEAVLEGQRRLGFFNEDVKEAARQVANFPGLFPQAYNVSHPILAAIMLARYIVGSKMSHAELLPYGSACSSALSVANDPKIFPAGLTDADRLGIQLCLTALQKFYDTSPIQLTPGATATSSPGPTPKGLFDSDAIPITDADSSMLCILREYELLNEIYGGDGNWQMCSQTHLEKDGRSYDVLEILVLEQGLKALWFDITDSKRLWTGHEDISAIARLNAALDAAKRDR